MITEEKFICPSCGHTFGGYRDEDGDVICISECRKPKRIRAIGCPACGYLDCKEDEDVNLDDEEED